MLLLEFEVPRRRPSKLNLQRSGKNASMGPTVESLGTSRLMAHACNPSCSGGRDQEDPWFKGSPGK
jgi:hypothetical protein